MKPLIQPAIQLIQRVCQHKIFVRLAYLVLGVLLLMAISIAAVPYYLKHALPHMVDNTLGHNLSIETITFNPFTLTLKGSHIVLYEANHASPLLSIDAFSLQVSLLSLFHMAPVIQEVRISEPVLHVIREKKGGKEVTNFDDLFSRLARPSSAQNHHYALSNIQLDKGTLLLNDKVNNQKAAIKAITIGLPFISTFKHDTTIFIHPYFYAQINGQPIEIKGRSRPFSDTHDTYLDIHLNQYDITTITAFLPKTLPIKLDSAQLSAALRLHFYTPAHQPYIQLAGNIRLDNLALSQTNNQPLLKAKKMAFNIRHINFTQGYFVLDTVRLDTPEVWATLDKKDYFNWAQLVASPSKGSPNHSTQPWLFDVGALSIKEGIVHWLDKAYAKEEIGFTVKQIDVHTQKLSNRPNSPPGLVTLTVGAPQKGQLQFNGTWEIPHTRLSGKCQINNLNIAPYQAYFTPIIQAHLAGNYTLHTDIKIEKKAVLLKNTSQQLTHVTMTPVNKKRPPLSMESIRLDINTFSNVYRNNMPFQLTAQIKQGEVLAIKGQAGRDFLEATLETKQIDLTPFSSYLAPFINVRLQQGNISSNGQFKWHAPSDVSYQGNITLGNFIANDTAQDKNLIRFKTVQINNAHIDWTSNKKNIVLSAVDLDAFYTRLILSEQGKLNIMSLLSNHKDDNVSPTHQTTTTPPPHTNQPSLSFKIGKMHFQRSTIQYTDNFITPHYNMRMVDMAGQIGLIDSHSKAPTSILLSGKIDNDASIAISGTFTPFLSPIQLDIKMTANGIHLPKLTSYATKYAGYPITRGKLSFAAEYKINNQHLVATNSLILNQLTLGERAQHSHAPDLPIPFVMSLLADQNGKIRLDLPISGSINDPEFSLGNIIVRAFFSLIGKAVLSPFTFLAHAFSGADQVSSITFDSGSATLSDASKTKLDTVAHILTQRPAYQLDITGYGSLSGDTLGLRQHKLTRQINKASTQGETETDDSQTEATQKETDRARAIKALYWQASFAKPRNALGLFKLLSTEDMENMLLNHIVIDTDDLNKLAMKRAEAVRTYLIDTAHISTERIFLVAPHINTTLDETGHQSTPSQVTLQLK